MQKIDKSINEIKYLHITAELNRGMNLYHPLVKFLLTVAYIIIVVSFDKYDISGVISMAVYPLAIFIVADLPLGEALHRLRVVLPLVCIVGVFNPFFDTDIAYVVGRVNISYGVISMFTLMFKGILTVLASYILIATTTIEKICYALRLLQVPKPIVTEIMLIYRYISVLLSEASRITDAYSLRAPGQKGIHHKVWGSLVGGLLLRSMDRAENVYESMCLRGYNGDFTGYCKEKIKPKDILFFVLWLSVFILFRIFKVVTIVGEIVGKAG